MDTFHEIRAAAAKVIHALELIMSPEASSKDRLTAYTVCEDMKERSPLCMQCGIFLAMDPSASDVVRHYGLQLMEHCIQYRWNNMSQAEKIFIKEKAMGLLNDGMMEVSGHLHIKNGLSKVIVEMVKREWPQQWPSLLDELHNACQQGEVQTEMVLMIFLRLVEDVALLQTLESNQRRKDIFQTLNSNMSQIFSFFIILIKKHYSAFETYTAARMMEKASVNARIVLVVLQTLLGFVDWVAIMHIMADNGQLLEMLCLLLVQDLFQAAAADVLLEIVNRKGRVEERKPLMILFSDGAMRSMYNAAESACQKPLAENTYNFLKKLTLVLTGLGAQLCMLWGKEDVIGCPNFDLYLNTILTFTRHPSLTIASYANTLWMSFFKHEFISKDEVFLTFIGKWVEATAPKIIKVSYPSARGGLGESYITIDYDSEEDFNGFFRRCRTGMLAAFGQATLISPHTTFGYVEQWLIDCIYKTAANPGVEYTLQSPLHLEWETLSQVLDSVLSRILLCHNRPEYTAGVKLLDMCLQYQPTDPLLLSTLLSCISALFVFLTMSPGDCTASLLPQVLDKIFSALVFSEPGQTKVSRSRAVENVRRHAASLMVKISHKYPLLLLPMFERIHSTVLSLNNDPAQLSKLEQVTLQEALLLISNHFCDYEKQTQFIAEVIGPVKEQWGILSEAFSSPQHFMKFVGLDRPPVEPSSDDVNGQNRAHILFCVHLLLAVVKRCSVPDDPDKAVRGGFVIGKTSSGNPICRNPAAPHVIPFLPQVFDLLKVFNALWTPDALAMLSEGYQSAHAMLGVDRANLLRLGNNTPIDPLEMTRPRNRTPLERMQHFLTMVHGNSYHMLGKAGRSLGRDFYGIEGLHISLVNSVFSNLEMIPDYRLRHVVRAFLKPFVCSCPPAYYETVLLPVLGQFCPFMLYKLNTKWQNVVKTDEKGQPVDENVDNQEVMDDLLNRLLTREYLEVLRVALVGGGPAESANCDTMEQDETMELNPSPPSQTAVVDVICESGTLLLRNHQTAQPIVLAIFRALTWDDTNVSLKAASLAGPMGKQLMADKNMTSGVADYIMMSVLQGLQAHGRHDANQGSLITLGLHIYELLRPCYPNVREIMMQIPDCNIQELDRLDEKLCTGSHKSKKESFKKIVKSLIGPSISQLFRKEVQILDLPHMPSLRSQLRADVIDEMENQEFALFTLFDKKHN